LVIYVASGLLHPVKASKSDVSCSVPIFTGLNKTSSFSICFVIFAEARVFLMSAGTFYCVDVEAEAESESESMDAEETEPTEELPPLTPAEAYIKRQADIAEAKKNIASICTQIMSSPEDNVCTSITLTFFIAFMESS
jgi:hypothetical protein